MQKLSFDREGSGISNLDGRLWGEIGENISQFFSDRAMVTARINIEALYLIELSKIGVIRKLDKKEIDALLVLPNKITPKVYANLRKIEAEVRHDVLTMTLIMKKLLSVTKSLDDVIKHGWIHWGLGSEDVDNLARALIIKNFLKNSFLPKASETLRLIADLSAKTKDIIIPGKTHLQTAVPTVLGKEIAIFGIRLAEVFAKIQNINLKGKLSGDVGNLNAHKIALPKINWQKFSKNFVESLGLTHNPYTTQIESRASLVELFQLIHHFNSILIDMSQDFRIYIGFGWFFQEVKQKESGSSAMPHKVNPIDFENSQGNSLLANWIFEGLIRQLPVSWLQRDLVDKTILRNLGLPFGYSLISLISANKGLSRIMPNLAKINDDLESDWSSLSEAFQAVLRASGEGKAYDKLKELTRGKNLTKKDIDIWINSLKIDKKLKEKLSNIDHSLYVGYAKENCIEMIKKILAVAKTPLLSS